MATTTINLSTLKPAKGARHKTKRVGRGIGSGLGKTAGRGHKGQRSTTSGNVRPGFEGGQMPLHRRLPKVGFKNPFRVAYTVVNVGALATRFAKGASVDPTALVGAGMVRSRMPVKVLGNGDLTLALNVKAHAFSAEARTKIEAAGGKIEIIRLKPEGPHPTTKVPKKKAKKAKA